LLVMNGLRNDCKYKVSVKVSFLDWNKQPYLH
jgi:hypothetical protein